MVSSSITNDVQSGSCVKVSKDPTEWIRDIFILQGFVASWMISADLEHMVCDHINTAAVELL